MCTIIFPHRMCESWDLPTSNDMIEARSDGIDRAHGRSETTALSSDDADYLVCLVARATCNRSYQRGETGHVVGSRIVVHYFVQRLSTVWVRERVSPPRVRFCANLSNSLSRRNASRVREPINPKRSAGTRSAVSVREPIDPKKWCRRGF